MKNFSEKYAFFILPKSKHIIICEMLMKQNEHDMILFKHLYVLLML